MQNSQPAPAPPASVTADKGNPVAPRFPKVGKELGIFAILVLLCVVVTAKNHLFLSGENLSNMAQLIGMYGIFSIGMGIVIITGGIDLSVGSIFALLGVLMAMELSEWHWPWPLAVLATLAGGGVLGIIHGLLITRLKLQPFIVTLCGLLFYRGVARYIAKDETKGFGDAHGFEVLKNAATGSFHGVPIPFIIMLIVAAIMWVALHRSVWGRYLYAVGRNEDAARYSGINTRAMISGAYVLSGVFAGITSILLAFYTNSISPSSHGNSYELYAVAAAVLGGCSLRGGEGSIFGILIGTILLQVLQNLVNLLGIDSSLNFAVMGAVILIGVIADQLFQSRKKKA